MRTKGNTRLYVKKFIVFILGLFLIQVGVAVMLRLNIGSDPFTVFTQGLSKTLHITAGNANRFITIFLGILLLFIDRTYIKIGTLISIIFAGSMMDLMYLIYGGLSLESYPLLLKSLFFLIALIPISLGIPMIKLAGIGVAPNDSVYFVLEDHLKQPYSRVRMASDAVYFVLGIVFGGVIGVGTILCLVCLGPMTGVTIPRVERLVKAFLKEKEISVKA